jgi:maltooligosyltrehalose synthase
VYQLYPDGAGGAAWGATEIPLPPGREWLDVFTGRKFDRQDRVQASELFADFPVCVLIAEPQTHEICFR